jgi:hypothetical protein
MLTKKEEEENMDRQDQDKAIIFSVNGLIVMQQIQLTPLQKNPAELEEHTWLNKI